MRNKQVETVILYYHEIPEMVKLLKQEQSELEDEYNGPRGIVLDGAPHGSTPGNPTATLVEQVDDRNTRDRLEEISVKMQVLVADAAVIRDSIDAVRGKYKRLIFMRYLHKYSWSRISVEIGVPDSTVRSWCVKAMERLGEALDDVPMADEILGRASRARA